MKHPMTVAVLAAMLTFSAGTSSAEDAPAWFNGFDEKSAGFEKVAVFVDAAVTRYLENGKVFVSKSESMSLASALDDQLDATLRKLGYAETAHAHLFSASYSDVTRAHASETGKPIVDQTAPFHLDPDVVRVAQLADDVRGAIALTADLAAGANPAGATLTEESARRIAGNYRANGIAVVIAVGHFEDKPVREFPTPDAERMRRLDAPLLAVAYYEGNSGKLVFFRRTIDWKKAKEAAVVSALKDMHDGFPKARVGGRFAVPPLPRFDSSKKDDDENALAFFAQGSDVESGFESQRLGVIKSRTPVPFSSVPTANRNDTSMISPNTVVRIIGRHSIYVKVVLRDGRVGWVPIDSVWLRSGAPLN
ncbi:MAG: hypothetical protein IT350_10310 [Deltaproteobacteria bacterium]|nr:hypothetical protein [Deltaproteobacteria bacterium]